MVEVTKGRGSLARAVESVSPLGCVILSGRTSFVASGAASVLEPLISAGAGHFEVNGPLPTTTEVDRLVAEIGPEMPNTLLAVGGGLVIDTMKTVALALATGRGADDLINGASQVPGELPLTIAAPTTSGSGAERTPFAVVYRHGLKYSIDDPRLCPNQAILDPRLGRSVPGPVASAAALDAVGHCVESIWACRSTDDSRVVASSALRRIVTHLEQAVLNEVEESRDELMYATSDAGAAITITRTTAAHALSYHLTSKYGIAHGHAVALLLGPVAALNESVDEASVLDDRGVQHVRSVVREACGVLGAPGGHELTGRLRELMRTLGLDADVDSAAGKKVDRQAWVAEVNMERLSNNPRRLNEEDLLQLVEVI